jgi:hypothetical protein
VRSVDLAAVRLGVLNRCLDAELGMLKRVVMITGLIVVIIAAAIVSAIVSWFAAVVTVTA